MGRGGGRAATVGRSQLASGGQVAHVGGGWRESMRADWRGMVDAPSLHTAPPCVHRMDGHDESRRAGDGLGSSEGARHRAPIVRHSGGTGGNGDTRQRGNRGSTPNSGHGSTVTADSARSTWTRRANRRSVATTAHAASLSPPRAAPHPQPTSWRARPAHSIKRPGEVSAGMCASGGRGNGRSKNTHHNPTLTISRYTTVAA